MRQTHCCQFLWDCNPKQLQAKDSLERRYWHRFPFVEKKNWCKKALRNEIVNTFPLLFDLLFSQAKAAKHSLHCYGDMEGKQIIISNFSQYTACKRWLYFSFTSVKWEFWQKLLDLIGIFSPSFQLVNPYIISRETHTLFWFIIF